MRFFLSLLITIISVAGCMSQKQGVTGKVLWTAGNQMPGPNNKNTPAQGVQREIHFYKAATLAQAKKSNGFFTEIQTELVAKVKSNEDGSFAANLPVGEYSVLTKEPQGLFANILDGNGRINVVKVENNKFEEITLQVNYQAAF
jgi:hypothetical protein